MRIALYVSRYAEEEVQTPPSLQYLAGYLIGKGLVKEEDIIFADNPEQVISFKPHILGAGSVSQTFVDAVNMAKEVRRALPECWTVLGGYHISALPQTLPEAFDIGVVGEGEITFSEIVLMRKKFDEPDTKFFHNIAGLCFRDENNIIVQTPKRPQIKDIDSLLPFRMLPYGYEWAYLFTARGCPYHCMYCASQSFWERYRPHSAEYVVNEIEKLKNDFGVTSIYLVDDLFIAPKKRLREIRRLMEERFLLGKVRFMGFVRVNLVDEEVIRILKEMGFVSVRFGMETASERLLKLIKDRPFTVEQAENVIRLCNKYKIPLSASFMFGIPGEEESDIDESRNFLRKHKGNFNISGFYLMQPIPGAKLWDDCLAKGLLSPDLDFSTLKLDFLKKDFDWNSILYLNSDKITLWKFKGIIEEIRDEFITQPPLKWLTRLATSTKKHFAGILLLIAQKLKSLVYNIFYFAGYEIRHIRPRTSKPKAAIPANKSDVRIYMGCGEETKEGYIGCDIRDLPNVAIVCNAWELSQHYIGVKEIYSRHMLEHLTLPQIEAAFKDWMSALAIGGKIHIIVPNIDYHIEQWRRAIWNEYTWDRKYSDARHSFAGFWGWQRESGPEDSSNNSAIDYWDVHKCGFNKTFLTFLLARGGFSDIECEVIDSIHLVANAVKNNGSRRKTNSPEL